MQENHQHTSKGRTRRSLMAGSTLTALGIALAGCIGNGQPGTPTNNDDGMNGGTPTQAPIDAAQEIHVAPDGSDADGDGSAESPFGSIIGARDHLREQDITDVDGPVVVSIAEGRYEHDSTVTFTPEDSGTESSPIVYRGPTTGEAQLSGGAVIEGWSETTINGQDAWKTTIDGVKNGEWYPKQLWIDGERRHRTRLPKAIKPVVEDYELLEKSEEAHGEALHPVTSAPSGSSAQSFEVPEGSVDADWHNLQDVEINAMKKWYDERMPIESVDGTSVTVSYRASWNNLQERDFYVENVKEALTEPGEWYCDNQTGDIWYLPMEGESPDSAEIIVPHDNTRLIDVQGKPKDETHVEHLAFDGLVFEHTGRALSPKGSIQAASTVRGAVVLHGVRNVEIRHSTLRYIGQYGVEVHFGSSAVNIFQNEVSDIGAGGVRMNGSTLPGGKNWYTPSTDPKLRTTNITVADNHINRYGQVYHRAVGILSQHASASTMAHNHIHNGFYSGYTVGWTWHYGSEAAEDENVVHHNHIHHIGRGLLSDMGGIYTLGRQPETELHHNYIHHVHEFDYGGWGIYHDQASTGILSENNVIHDCLTTYHQHWGSENEASNNVLAFGREAVFSYANNRLMDGAEHGYHLRNNVLVANGESMFVGGYAWEAGREGGITSNNNLLWNYDGDVYFGRTTGIDLPGPVTDVYGSHVGNEDWAGITQNHLSFKYEADGESSEWVSGFEERGIDSKEPEAGWPGNGSNFIGFQFTVGDDPVTVTHLGRYVLPDNDQTHHIKLLDRDASEQVAITKLDTTTVDGNTWEYAELDEPVTLEANTAYYLVCQEFNGGDKWYNKNRLQTTDVASVDAAVWRIHYKAPIVPTLSIEDWRAIGKDSDSIVEDPQFENWEERNLAVEDSSPAMESPVNFDPIDISDVGPRDQTPQ